MKEKTVSVLGLPSNCGENSVHMVSSMRLDTFGDLYHPEDGKLGRQAKRALIARGWIYLSATIVGCGKVRGWLPPKAEREGEGNELETT